MSKLFHLLILTTISMIIGLQDNSNDPSLGAGTIALPLALQAKRIKEQNSVVTTATLSNLMPATPANNYYEQHKVETLFPTQITTKEPVLMGNQKPKSSDLSFKSQPPVTTPLNDIPLLHTTATNPPSTLNDPLTTVTPILITSTKLALRSGKHHRHGKSSKTPEDSSPSKKDSFGPDENDGAQSAGGSTTQSTASYENRERCMNSQTKEFINSATTCKDERSAKICSLLFEDPDPKSGKRDSKCNVSGMEDIANSCRRQCGICCEHIDYACEDDSNHIIDCNKQLDKCQMAKWFDVLARFCAGSCGLCTRTACRDYSVKCREMKHLCLESSNIDFMRANCSRTCGFCVVGPGGISTDPLKRLPIPQCVDHASNCTENESLCSSPTHAEFMIKYCAKTCFKCSGDGSSQVIVPIIGTSPELNGTAAVLVPTSVIMGAARPGNNECVDHHPKCAIWVAKGFCTHSKYTNEQRMALCPKSCHLC